jgi:zinc transporter 9
MKYVASLISGVGIFCVGTGLSFYHGVTGLLNPMPMESFYWVRFLSVEIYSGAWTIS